MGPHLVPNMAGQSGRVENLLPWVNIQDKFGFDMSNKVAHLINTISLKEAQQLILASQRLIGPTLKPIQIIEHLGYVQIDTISVVERAHHHVFWSRNPKYRPSDLDDLVRSRDVFEYWSHAASFLPS